MRKIKNIFALCLSLIMILLTVGGITTVSAAPAIDAAAYFSAENNGFVVEGTVTNTEVDNVSISIYRPGYTIDMVEADIKVLNSALCNHTNETLVDGAFTYTCSVTASDVSGYYTVYINYGGEELEVIENVYYAIPDDVEDALDRINDITGTSAEKYDAFNEEVEYLGKLPVAYENLDETEQEKVIDKVLNEESDYASVAEIITAIEEESIKALILNPADADAVKYVADNYNDIVGFDFENVFYKKYVEGNSAKVDAVYSYVAANKPYADETAVKNAFQQGVIVQSLNSIKTKGELYNRAMGSVSILGDKNNIAVLPGIEMTKFINYTDTKQDKILTSFFTDKKYKVNTIEKFVSNWNAAVKGTVGGSTDPGPGPDPKPPINDPTIVTPDETVVNGPVAGPTPGTNNGEELVFADLGSVPWAADSITALAKAGIVNGKDAYNFAPNDNITREEFLKMLYLCANLKVNEEAQTTFIDVNKGEWYYGIVASAQEQGLVNGVSNVHFGVGQNITRQDMSVMIVRMISSLGIELDLSSDTSKFVDDASIAPYANVSVYTMKRAGIINGYEDGSFGPNAYATRAEAAKIIYALCSLLVD